jgi:hypothetical protein
MIEREYWLRNSGRNNLSDAVSNFANSRWPGRARDDNLVERQSKRNELKVEARSGFS